MTGGLRGRRRERWRLAWRRAWQSLLFRRRTLAAAALWPVLYPAAWLWRRTALRHTAVWAVTGSVGKTSTAAALAAAAGATFDPDAPNHGAFLAAALLRRRPGSAPIVLEVGISRPGQMRAYARLLQPDLAVLTAIGTEHLHAFAGGQAELAREKALLPRAVAAGGLVVVNGDDPRCRAIGSQCAARVVTVGTAPDCEWRIAAATADFPHGTRLRLESGGATLELCSRWLGPDLPRCAALAAAAALSAAPAMTGAADVAARIAALTPIAGRLEALALPGGAWLLHDAWKGHWPTYEAALGFLCTLGSWRRVAVLGALEEPPGSQSAAYRDFGRLAAAAAQRILFVGALTDFARLRSGVRQHGAAAPPLEHYDGNLERVAAALQAELTAGTVILLKGRHSQKLGRLAHLLRGQPVACRLRYCPARGRRCELCPRLR